jgi:hypothetical protein
MTSVKNGLMWCPANTFTQPKAVILGAAKNLAAAIFAAVMGFHGKPLENHAAQDAARDPSTPLADSLRSG